MGSPLLSVSVSETGGGELDVDAGKYPLVTSDRAEFAGETVELTACDPPEPVSGEAGEAGAAGAAAGDDVGAMSLEPGHTVTVSGGCVTVTVVPEDAQLSGDWAGACGEAPVAAAAPEVG